MKEPYKPVRRKPSTPHAKYVLPYRANADRQIEDCKLLDNSVAVLMEHFDTVQIVATRHGIDGTCCAARGAGNIYARAASIREWLVKDNEESRQMMRPRENGDSEQMQ